MVIHSVFFWLQPGTSEAQRAEFAVGLEALRSVAGVDSLFVGKPAAIEPRPVVDDSYSYALSIMFKDLAAHDAYQVDPAHKAFIEKFRALWAKVQIYDAAN